MMWEHIETAVTIAATFVTATATAALVWVTWILAKYTRNMARATNQPHIVATVEINRWSFIHADLVVQNTGNATAYDISVEFDPPLKIEKKDLGERKLPYRRISVLKPGQHLESGLGKMTDYWDKSFNITISWHTNPNLSTRESHTYNLDIADYKNVGRLGDGDPLVKIAQEVKSIREELKKFSSGSNKLKVDVFQREDREKLESDLSKQYREDNHTKSNDIEL